jgi:glycerol-3-phosphate acyltransferase PlsY
MTPYAMYIVAVCCGIAYLVGSIPFGLLLGRLFGAGDIRKIGSGNIGATNMLRTGRKGLALATLALDFAKGILGIAMAQGLCNYYYSSHGGDFMVIPSIIYLAGLAAVLGHVFPVWLNFKGGKGVATTLGVFLATQPFIGASTIAGWVLIFYLSRTSSLAAIGSIACAPVLGYLYAGSDFTAMSAVIAFIVIYKHKDNMDRIRQGTETRWKKKNDPS